MSTEHIGDEYPQESRRSLNENAVAFANSEGERLRSHVISMAYAAVSAFFEKDQETLGGLDDDRTIKGTKTGLYILDDMLAVPMFGGEYGRALTLQLVQNGELIRRGKLPDTDAARLKLSVPVPADFNALEDSIVVPDEVYIERKPAGQDQPEGYVVSNRGVYRYRFGSYADRDDMYADMSFDIIAHQAMNRVDSSLGLLGGLIEDMANMDVVPQRYVSWPSTPSW